MSCDLYSSQILGPAIFGFTYVRTVATYPRAIFFLSVAAVFSAFILLGFVRIPKHVRVDEEDGVPFEASSMSRDATLIGGDGAEGDSPKKP